MFFTQEDYRKIERWLLANSRKDTDFVGATTPLKGNETVVLVQDGKNVKTSVKDIVDQFFLLGVSDFLNITDKYGESYISLTQAIQLIPFRSRKIGQVITFIDESRNWAIYQFQGKALNQWNNTTLWIDLLAKISGIPIIDSEDITTKENGANQVSLYLADKQYNEADYSGLGRIYLRKNIQNIIDPSTGKVINVNLLTQSMLDKENTIYIIQYDFDLNGQEITIPEGCVLDFQGGSLNNGTIVGYNTAIKAELVKIFSLDTNISGTWNITEAYPEWFGAVGDGNTDDYKALNDCFLVGSSNKIKISLCGKKVYTVKQVFNNHNDILFKLEYLDLDGNNSTINIGTIGDYDAIFNVRGDVANIKNLIITLSEDNIVTTNTGTLGYQRKEISVGSKPNTKESMVSTIDNVTINNAIGVWQFLFVRALKGVVKNSTINYTLQPLEYDRTSIYLYGIDMECYNNTLNGTKSALTGIEFHGSNVNVYNNIVRDYTNPIFIVNDIIDLSATKCQNLVLYNNYLKGKKEIKLWLELDYDVSNIIIDNNNIITTGKQPNITFHSATGAYTLDNLIIRNNTLTQTQEGSGACLGIYINSKASNENPTILKTFKISNNIFRNNGYQCFDFTANSDINVLFEDIHIDDNIIYLRESGERFLLNINNTHDFYKNIYFRNNKVYNNSYNVTAVLNPNSLNLVYDSIFFENQVRLVNEYKDIQYKNCLFNTDFNNYYPICKMDNCYDVNGIQAVNKVRIKASEVTTIFNGKSDIELLKGDNIVSLYDNFKLNKSIVDIDFKNCNYPFTNLASSCFSTSVNILNLKGLNSKKLYYMASAFVNSNSSKILVNFDKKDVNISTAFSGSKATYINLEGADLSKMTSMNYVFNGCANLREIVFDDFLFSNTPTFTQTFSGCFKLEHISINKTTQEFVKLIVSSIVSQIPNRVVTYTTSTIDSGYISADIYITINRSYGTFSNKPSDANVGEQYFCTDKQTVEGGTTGIMIYHKGNNVWVDALGRVVS